MSVASMVPPKRRKAHEAEKLALSQTAATAAVHDTNAAGGSAEAAAAAAAAAAAHAMAVVQARRDAERFAAEAVIRELEADVAQLQADLEETEARFTKDARIQQEENKSILQVQLTHESIACNDISKVCPARRGDWCSNKRRQRGIIPPPPLIIFSPTSFLPHNIARHTKTTPLAWQTH